LFASSTDKVVLSSQTCADIWKSVSMLKETKSRRHSCLVLFFNFKCNSARNGCACPPFLDRCNVL